MKKVMFVYTQTSGIQKDYNTSVFDFENWTRLVTISWFTSNEYLDSWWSTGQYRIVRPIGFTINTEAERFNQIPFERAVNEGKPLIEILNEIIKISQDVDCFIGHNIEFHLNVLRSELIRSGLGDIENHNSTICLMKNSVNYCKLTSTKGYKYPSLDELYLCLFKTKIKYLKYGNKYIDNFNAIKDCYIKMFKSSCFLEYDFNPDPNIELLKIPFKEEEFPTKTFIQVKNNDNDKLDVYIDDILVYKNYDEVKKTDNWGLYLFKKKNDKKTEYLLTDYRGVQILKTVDREITFGFDQFDDEPEVKVNGIPIYGLAFYQGGLFLHNYSYRRYYVRSLVLDDYFCLYSDSQNLKNTIIDYKTGVILFRDDNIVFHENSDKFIKCFLNKFEVYTKKSIKIDTVNFSGRIIDFTEDGKYLYFKNDNIGIIDLLGNVLVPDKYEYIDLIEDSDHYYIFCLNENYGIINIHNKVIFESEYKFDVIYEYNYFHIINNIEEKPIHGLVNTLGEVVIPIDNDELIPPEYEKDGFYEIKKNKNEKGVYFFKKGVFIEPKYSEVDLRDKYIFVSKNGFEGIIDYLGNIVMECKYVFGRDYTWTDMEMIVVKNKTKNELYSLLNQDVLLKDFDDIVKIGGLKNEGFYIAVIKKGLVKFKNLKNTWESDYIYESWFQNPKMKGLRIGFRANRLLVLKNGLFGFVDSDFNEVITCKYEFANSFEGSVALVKQGGEMFYIDINDNVVKNI